MSPLERTGVKELRCMKENFRSTGRGANNLSTVLDRIQNQALVAVQTEHTMWLNV